MIWQIKKNSLYQISKKKIIFGILYTGILLAYLGSLSPWFLWPIAKVYIIICTLLLGTAIFLDNISKSKIFAKKDWLVPSIIAFILLIFQRIVNKGNIIGFTEAMLNSFVIFCLFKLSTEFLIKSINTTCMIMGGFLILSMGAFLLYFLGLPFPSAEVNREDLLYDFDNFYLFMLGRGNDLIILPRFQSVFLEPGHLGTATSLLLFTQIGSWKKWYNLSLLTATILSFSLAAYVLLIIIAIMGAWTRHKKIVAKLCGIVIILATIAVSSLFYNKGENLINELILSRLEVDSDGKLVGDNRVTGAFESVYDNYITSSDIWFGKDYSIEEFGFGNAGYRVFIYDYGLICLLLVIFLYLTMAFNPNNKRAWIAMLIVATAGFWVRATPVSFYFMIPLYSVPFIKFGNTKPTKDLTDKETDVRNQ